MKVTPSTKMHNEILFSKLKPGDAFFWRGGIWMKIDDGKQGTVSLKTGEYLYDMYKENVVLVDATVTWVRKDTKKKK